MKNIFLLIGIVCGLFITAIFSNVFAADIEAVLDTNNGTSAFSVQDSGSVEVASIDSDGNIQGANIAATGAITQGGVAIVPSGVIVMWSGILTSIPSGWVLCNGSNGTPDLRDRFIVGAANGANPGTTGGASTHSHGIGTYDSSAITAGTPVGTVSQPTFTGSALGTHQHAAITAGTPTGTNSIPSFTGTASTVVVNHVHVQNCNTAATGANVGYTRDASSSGSGVTAISTANPTGGAVNYTPAGTVSAPTFTGTALGTHQHDAITAGTPAGTVSQPTFTGSQLGTHDHTLSGSSETVSNVPSYYALAFIMKT